MRRVFLAAVLAAVFALPAAAQQRVTEDEFLQALTSDHPAVRAGADRVGVAEGELRRTRSLENPTIGFWREAPEHSPEVTNWTLSWTPPLDGRRGPRIDAAEAGVRAAESDLSAQRLQLRYDLREAYARWAIGAERQQTIQSQISQIEKLATQLQARADKGEESPLASRRLELTLLDVRTQAIQAEAGVLRAEAAALAWLPAGSHGVEPALPDLPPVPDTLTSGDRPDLAALRFEEEQARQRSRAGGRIFRFPEISVGWQQLNDSGIDDGGPLVGVALSLPLFERNQGDQYQSKAMVSVAEARTQFLTRQAEAELAGAVAAYDRLRTGALQSREAASRADRVIESAAATFRLGESQLTDLLETLRSALTARLAAIELYSAALEAHRELELAVGRPLGPDGGSR